MAAQGSYEFLCPAMSLEVDRHIGEPQRGRAGQAGDGRPVVIERSGVIFEASAFGPIDNDIFAGLVILDAVAPVDKKRVDAGAPEKDVLAVVAKQKVSALLPDQLIVAVPPAEHVASGRAEQVIGAASAKKIVTPPRAPEHVIA